MTIEIINHNFSQMFKILFYNAKIVQGLNFFMEYLLTAKNSYMMDEIA